MGTMVLHVINLIAFLVVLEDFDISVLLEQTLLIVFFSQARVIDEQQEVKCQDITICKHCIVHAV
jgi:hypothetical protein